jgi:hypothetical protein
MPHALDFHDFRIAKKFIHDSVIADANAVGALGTSQFFRTAWQRFISELRHFGYDARYRVAGNPAQILFRGCPSLQIKGGHRA